MSVVSNFDEYNLNYRILLHNRFSTNDTNWFNWIFYLMSTKSGEKILELGAGNGEMWVRNNDALPIGATVLVSDISEEFLNQSRGRINNKDNAYKFEVIDMHNIGYSAATFDKVLANTMLYHSNNIGEVLNQISNVMKNDGQFFATTSGLDHLIELKEIVCEFDSRILFPLNGENKKFCLENGESILNPFFKNVECVKFDNLLRITDIDYFYEFIASFKDDRIHNIAPIIENQNDFKGFLQSKMRRGYVEITKSNCMFISSNV